MVLLEAQKHELKPEPGDHQHQQHVGKSKTEPAGKVDHVSVSREEPSEKKVTSDQKSRNSISFYVVVFSASLVHLTLEDEVWCCAGERGRSSDAGRVSHTQTHPFSQEVVLLLHGLSSRFSPRLCILHGLS